METTKDSIANLTTVAGAGSAVIGIEPLLTIVLIITGIALNIIRIYEIKKKKGDTE